MSERPAVHVGELLVEGIRGLVSAPFRVLVLLAILASLAADSAGNVLGEGTVIALLILALISAYLQIAAILAAGRPQPIASADIWIRGALARRCFWHYFIARFIAVLCIVAGFFILVVGAFFMAGFVALAETAAVVERRTPFDAIARSAQLAEGSRVPIAVVFGVFNLLPGVVLLGGQWVGLADDFPDVWPFVSLLGVMMSMAGSIALTRAFVKLGGNKTPGPEDIVPKGRGNNHRG